MVILKLITKKEKKKERRPTFRGGEEDM